MKLPRDLHGSELVKHLVRHWAYKVESQRGSHIILKTESPIAHRMPIPAHRPLSAGTLRAILAEVCEVKKTTRDQLLQDL